MPVNHQSCLNFLEEHGLEIVDYTLESHVRRGVVTLSNGGQIFIDGNTYTYYSSAQAITYAYQTQQLTLLYQYLKTSKC